MNNETHQYNILDMFDGNLRFQVDQAIKKVIDNILDQTTREETKRSITIEINFFPYANRLKISSTATVKTKLVPADSNVTTLVISSDEDGVPTVTEWNGQFDGQQSL